VTPKLVPLITYTEPLTTVFDSTPFVKIETSDSGVAYISLKDSSQIFMLTLLSYTGTFMRKLGGYFPLGTYSPVSNLSCDNPIIRLKLSRTTSSLFFLPNRVPLFSTAHAIIKSSKSSRKL